VVASKLFWASALRAGTLPWYGGHVYAPNTSNTGLDSNRLDSVNGVPWMSSRVNSTAGSPWFSPVLSWALLDVENSVFGQLKQPATSAWDRLGPGSPSMAASASDASASDSSTGSMPQVGSRPC